MNEDSLGGVGEAVKTGRGGSKGGGNVLQFSGIGVTTFGLYTWLLSAAIERKV